MMSPPMSLYGGQLHSNLHTGLISPSPFSQFILPFTHIAHMFCVLYTFGGACQVNNWSEHVYFSDDDGQAQ